MNTTNRNAIATDEFCQDSFINRNLSLPTVIVLNHEIRCGYYIPLQTMSKIDWVDFDENQLVEHTFGSGSTELGFLIKNPRMLCVAKTDLYQYDDDESKKQKSKVVVGLYNADLKENKNIRQERIYLVYFLDYDNNFLHRLPLKYVARGVNGATFEEHRKAFRTELEACHAIFNKMPPKPKNDLFHSLGVFSFQTKAELAGKGNNRSWTCRVASHDKPRADNWQKHFIGYSAHKDYIWASLEPDSAMALPGVPAIALPGLPQLAPSQVDTGQKAATYDDVAYIPVSEYLSNPEDEEDIPY